MANAMCSGRLALNDPWVRCRWYPTVTPNPETVKKTDEQREVRPAQAPAPGDGHGGERPRGRGRSRTHTARSARRVSWCPRRRAWAGQLTGPASVAVCAGGVWFDQQVMGDHLSLRVTPPNLRRCSQSGRRLVRPIPGRLGCAEALRPSASAESAVQTVVGRLGRSRDGGWGNRQPAGLWSLAVSVRVRVPQHQPTRPAPFPLRAPEAGASKQPG